MGGEAEEWEEGGQGSFVGGYFLTNIVCVGWGRGELLGLP